MTHLTSPRTAATIGGLGFLWVWIPTTKIASEKSGGGKGGAGSPQV
eukprot:CAMPEP_0198236778 /NCGR_PEP_ID=MMETSP1446-20131203/2671_1 /TAXON_ID=1461542 ORGANISM="Unidentified sp, Strain CCMP2111" /NCGR_SAMPLE_ID=MMETSP1446 /ASSEMBLY_ACC=CAM_ASM_001112 /LENGTH=45 /DNA_ID= /DNA_START= /DNA_END= /DNA_ORIENTATION=